MITLFIRLNIKQNNKNGEKKFQVCSLYSSVCLEYHIQMLESTSDATLLFFHGSLLIYPTNRFMNHNSSSCNHLVLSKSKKTHFSTENLQGTAPWLLFGKPVHLVQHSTCLLKVKWLAITELAKGKSFIPFKGILMSWKYINTVRNEQQY